MQLANRWKMRFAFFLIFFAFETALGQNYIEYEAPGNKPFGMGWDGNHLWIGDEETQLLYQVDVSDSFVVVGVFEKGGWGDLAWDGSHF
ncbi:MAG: hypothetical protein ACE5IW_04550, partial [bacterium]